MKNDFISSGRCISDLKAHLVLTTKYRRKVFTGQMINRLSEILTDLCTKWGCKLVEFNGEEDHIHLLFQYLPQMELPKFVGNLKSVSSRKIREEFADEVKKYYWKSVCGMSHISSRLVAVSQFLYLRNILSNKILPKIVHLRGIEPLDGLRAYIPSLNGVPCLVRGFRY